MKPSKLSKFTLYMEWDKTLAVIKRETKKRSV